MQSHGTHYRSIWHEESSDSAAIFDQTLLPHELRILELNSLGDVCHAISSMQVRGAPLIGACAAYGMYFALRADSSAEHEKLAAEREPHGVVDRLLQCHVVLKMPAGNTPEDVSPYSSHLAPGKKNGRKQGRPLGRRSC